MSKLRVYHMVLGRAIILLLFATVGCNVHEWPELPERVSYLFHLRFETEMPIQHMSYGMRTRRVADDLELRYLVRAYPILGNGNVAKEYVDELVFVRPVTDDFDLSFVYDLPEGRYRIRVWVDYIRQGGVKDYLYDTSDFAFVELLGEHRPNSDERDAFVGERDVTLVADIVDRDLEETTIEMLRPMGKFEFITTDLFEFMSNESRNGRLSAVQDEDGEVEDVIVNLDDYRVVFFYVGFMPNAFSLIDYKPVDAVTGVYFSSRIEQISETEASMGFDYVFVNGKESVTTVVVGIYNRSGEQLGMTAPIDVPIKRGIHTVVEGKFLLEDNKGGVHISPDFDGEYNLVFP